MAENAHTSELSWLTKEFLQEVLRTSEGASHLEVTWFSQEWLPEAEVSPFCRRRHRVAVEFHTDTGPPKTLSLQVCTLPHVTLARELEVVGRLTEREALVYRKVLPRMRDILREVGVSPLTLREFPSRRAGATLTEDAPRGRRDADLPTCELAVRALARFHAASAALLERSPELVSRLREPVYVPGNEDLVLQLHGPGLESLATAAEGWPDYRHFAARLREFARRVPKLLARACAPEAAVRPLVLGHGRFEAGNLALGGGDDGRLLDLRWCRAAGPALDLHHFLASSAEDAVRAQYSGHLLDEYLKTFRRTAHSLRCRATLDEKRLDAQMNDTAFYALVAATTDLQLRRHEGSSGEMFRKSMQKMLLRLEYNGVL